MMLKPWMTGAVALGLVLGLPTRAWAQAFKPFTPVPSVCPSCTNGPKYDRILLRDGTEVRARVLAENEVFYVLEKFGEFRAVGRDQVQTVELNRDVDRPVGYGDQILFKNDIVLAGTLTDSHATDSFAILVPRSASPHVAPKSAVAYVYGGGKPVFVAAKDR